MTKEEIIYFAGLIDGEGYLGITTKGIRRCGDLKYQSIFRIQLTYREVIEKYANLLNVKIKTFYKNHPIWKDSYGFSLYDKRAENIIRIIYPYLIVKKS